MNFWGRYPGKVDKNNRTTFPAKFREQTGDDNLLIANWFEQSLVILPKDHGSLLIEDLQKESILSPQVRELESFIMGGAQEIELDIDGRFVIPEPLITYATITEKVVFKGGMFYVRLWDIDVCDNYEKITSLRSEDTAKRIALITAKKKYE